MLIEQSLRGTKGMRRGGVLFYGQRSEMDWVSEESNGMYGNRPSRIVGISLCCWRRWHSNWTFQANYHSLSSVAIKLQQAWKNTNWLNSILLNMVAVFTFFTFCDFVGGTWHLYPDTVVRSDRRDWQLFWGSKRHASLMRLVAREETSRCQRGVNSIIAPLNMGYRSFGRGHR